MENPGGALPRTPWRMFGRLVYFLPEEPIAFAPWSHYPGPSGLHASPVLMMPWLQREHSGTGTMDIPPELKAI